MSLDRNLEIGMETVSSKIPEWQDNYIAQLNREYKKLFTDEMKIASDIFWKLEKRIKEVKRAPA